MSENETTGNNWLGLVWKGAIGLAGILALVFAVYTWVIDRENRELESLLLSDIRLSSLQDIPSIIEISYDGQQIEDVRIITIQIRNTGNRDILKSEFEGPVELETTDDWRIVSVSAVDKDPSNLSDDFDWDNHVAKIQPLLLNKDDSMKIEIVMVAETSNPDSEAIERFDARIAGIKELKLAKESVIDYGEEPPFLIWLAGIFTGLMVMALFMQIVYDKKIANTQKDYEKTHPGG